MHYIDTILNRMSMYRLVMYLLTGLVLYAALVSFFGALPYAAGDILVSAGYLLVVAVGANWVFGRIFGAHENRESAVISALILTLIIGPVALFDHIAFVTFVAVAAMASKYLLVWRRRHIFNPAAVAVVALVLVLGQGASWWIGMPVILPLVVLFGVLITRKIGRAAMVTTFLSSYILLFLITNRQILSSFEATGQFLWSIAAYTPILFFAFIMLPEPQTSPKRKWNGVAYAFIVAAVLVFFQAQLRVPYTLELSLLFGNVCAFMFERSARLRVRLREKKEEAPSITSFWFDVPRPVQFTPGQFFEWTLYHPRADNRGIRRYFTVASSPDEDGVLLTTKFSDDSSSFKEALAHLSPGDEMMIVGPQGDFVLPHDTTKKCAFIAGGIGVTPFRSMITHLVLSGEKRDIALLYAARSARDFVFTDLFDDAAGVRTVYAVSEEEKDDGWDGEVGRVDAAMIRRTIPDWKERVFYISGPEPMVRALGKEIAQMGVSKGSIRHDYFPGYEEL